VSQVYYCLSFLVSTGSFWISYLFSVKKYSDKSILIGGLSLLTGTLLVVFMGVQALPNYPITQTKTIFQSQPAPVAYLKDLSIYLLPIFFIAVTIPYVSVLTWQRELEAGNHKELLRFLRSRGANIKGTANLSARWMIIGLFLLFLYSFSTTFYLFNNLEPSENLNTFSYLAIIRNSIYFLVGLIGIGWYYENRNKIIAQCRKSL
jgi:hypothetical protein